MEIVAFQIEMRKIESDAILFGSDNLPDAILRYGVHIREWGRCDCSIETFNEASTSICNEKKKKKIRLNSYFV